MLNKRILTLVFVVAFLTLLVGCFPSPAVPNQAPIITSSPVTTATVGEAYTYDVNATDPDGDTLTYSLATPAGMTINSATGLISWIPAAKGDYAVVVKVTDDGSPVESTTQSFTITVSEPGTPPGPSPAPPTKTYTITVTFGSGGSISPSGAVTVNKGANKIFTITPYSPFYRLLEVLVDGGPVGVVSTYTFTNVTADHTIHADFTLIGPVYNETQDDHYGTIQEAINDAGNPVNTILVAPGTYNEDVTINKSIILVSTEGKDNTTINGQLGGGQDVAVGVTNGVSDVVFGNTGKGFTVNGPGGVAVFLGGTNDNITIRDNKIVIADGRCALETSGLQSNHTIADNEFSGIAAQLVYIGGETSHGVVGSSTNVNFTNNTFAGTATGPALGQEATDSTISGNTFATITGYASLELWGTGNTVTGNDFTADLPTGGLYVLDNPNTLDIAAVLINNTFLRAVTVEHNSLLPKIWAYIQDAINEAVNDDTVIVEVGTYHEAITINKTNLILQSEASLGAIIKPTTTPVGWPEAVIYITANGVTVDGFEVDGTTVADNGILGWETSGLTIKNNEIHGAVREWDGCGILIFSWSNSGTVYDNLIENNEVYDTGRMGIMVMDRGANYSVTSGNTITGNTVYDVWKKAIEWDDHGGGIQINVGKDCAITNNEIYNVQSGQRGIYMFGSASGNTITGNTIRDNEIGVQIWISGEGGDTIVWGIESATSPQVYYNNIYDNSSYGAISTNIQGTLMIMDAIYNWWGDATGPFHTSTNPPGLGNEVSNYVDFSSWCISPN